MSGKSMQGRADHKKVLAGLKRLAAVVDNVIFDMFKLHDRGYKVDGSDTVKPLGFQTTDNRFFKQYMIRAFRNKSELDGLQPPFRGVKHEQYR